MAIALLVVAAALFVGIIPDRETICDKGNNLEAEKCTTYDFLPFILVQVTKTLNDYNGLVTSIATILIAWFTIELSRVGRDQHSAAMDAISLSRDEFNASHRPRFVVRDVRYAIDEQKPSICLAIVNIGDSVGRIVESGLEVKVVPTGGFAKNIKSAQLAPDEINNIRAGHQQEVFITVNLAEQIMMLPRHTYGDTSVAGSVHVFGNILYEDGMGRRRRTIFQRRHVRDEDVFMELGNPNYEYAD